MPMLTLTTRGRRSGRPRSVHLACVEHEGHPLVVASAMGQERHPAWRYNLEANPEVQVQMPGERFQARAELLTDAEKQAVWSELRAGDSAAARLRDSGRGGTSACFDCRRIRE